MDAVHQAIDTAKREWAELMASSAVERGDAEVEHGKRDEILIRLVAALDPEFGQVVDDREGAARRGVESFRKNNPLSAI